MYWFIYLSFYEYNDSILSPATLNITVLDLYVKISN